MNGDRMIGETATTSEQIDEISDAEVAEIKARYEQAPMTCWFCKKKIPWEQLADIEDHESYAACGYCYCKKCIGRFRTSFNKLPISLRNMVGGKR